MGWTRNDRPNRIGKREQLCWSCEKCISMCSWSREFIPIPGWDAIEEHHTRADERNVDSYKIYNCPEYKRSYAYGG